MADNGTAVEWLEKKFDETWKAYGVEDESLWFGSTIKRYSMRDTTLHSPPMIWLKTQNGILGGDE